MAEKESSKVPVTADTNKGETFRDRWRKAWSILLGTIAYMTPLFWFWQKTGYPESFGFRITAHGKAGIFESWYYSYRLIQRRRILDVMTFIYMWLAVVGVAGWIARLMMEDRRASAKKWGDAV